MQARQSDRMATVQSFLNEQWKSESDGTQWFDPSRDSLYPDRIRRRPAGADSAGLGTHLDPGTLDLWMTEAYQQTFRHLFDGTVESYDPWDAAHRTAGPQYPGTTMCSAFRTFQGWTALSDMAHDQGVLHTVPIPEAMAYLMLRPLLSDVADDDMCGVTTNQTFPANEKWHPLLMEALAGIPDVRAGDSVWWHCDMIHSVAPVTDQQGEGNVMYIPAAPWCPRNEAYSVHVREAFLTGASPSDFPAENYESQLARSFPVRRPQPHRPAGPRPGLSADRSSRPLTPIRGRPRDRRDASKISIAPAPSEFAGGAVTPARTQRADAVRGRALDVVEPVADHADVVRVGVAETAQGLADHQGLGPARPVGQVAADVGEAVEQTQPFEDRFGHHLGLARGQSEPGAGGDQAAQYRLDPGVGDGLVHRPISGVMPAVDRDDVLDIVRADQRRHRLAERRAEQAAFGHRVQRRQAELGERQPQAGHDDRTGIGHRPVQIEQDDRGTGSVNARQSQPFRVRSR